jgi:hypothetical protein
MELYVPKFLRDERRSYRASGETLHTLRCLVCSIGALLNMAQHACHCLEIGVVEAAFHWWPAAMPGVCSRSLNLWGVESVVKVALLIPEG